MGPLSLKKKKKEEETKTKQRKKAKTKQNNNNRTTEQFLLFIKAFTYDTNLWVMLGGFMVEMPSLEGEYV